MNAVANDCTLQNAQLDAFTTFAGDAGKLRIYSGTRPATGGAITTLLAELTMNTIAFQSAVSGVSTANAITCEEAVATGTATWARLFKSDGTTVVCDLDVSITGHEVTLDTLSIVAGKVVSCPSMVITVR